MDSGVRPPSPGFTGVMPPPGFSGVVPKGTFAGPTLNPLYVKEAVVGLRQAWVAQAGDARNSPGADAKSSVPTDKGSDRTDATGPPDYFADLELKRGATEEAIKKNYRKLVLIWHPDKRPREREAADEKIRQINVAYETLGNPVKREGYLQMLEAIDRKKRNLKLDVSFIQPRMNIPKEFMLCPLGHPDKFVRAVDNKFKVQSREAVGGNFNEFFAKAKFTLWWLPEVNNMCRLRTAESASSGQEGGMFLNFNMAGKPTESDGQLCTSEAVCVLKANEDPRYSNLIAVASPFSPGAFRFEGAFWPGHYLSFRTPGTVCMAPLVDEVKDITDFYLVDYTAAYKTMTLSEALFGPVSTHGNGNWVKLSELRADHTVRAYFQNVLKCPVWNNREFEDYFEGHYDQWDFDKKRASIRPRTPQQQMTEHLNRAESSEETARIVQKAGEELSALSLQTVRSAFYHLATATGPHKPPAVQAFPKSPATVPPQGFGKRGGGKGVVPTVAAPRVVPTVAAPLLNISPVPTPPAIVAATLNMDSSSISKETFEAMQKILKALPSICAAAKKTDGTTLPAILSLRTIISKCKPEQVVTESRRVQELQKDAERENEELRFLREGVVVNRAGSDGKQANSNTNLFSDEELAVFANFRKEGIDALATLASDRLSGSSDKITGDVLNELLDLPLAWAACTDRLKELLTPLLAEPKPVGSFLELLQKVCRAGASAKPLAEMIGFRELKSLNLAPGNVAGDMLLSLAGAQVLLPEVCSALREPVLGRLELPTLVKILAIVAAERPDDENLRAALETRIQAPANNSSLSQCSAAVLLDLAETSRKSSLVETLGLEAIAAAVPLAKSTWTPTDVLKLCACMASSKVCRDRTTTGEIYVQGAGMLASSDTALSADLLLQLSQCLGSLDHGANLLRAVTRELAGRMSELNRETQLPILTEALLNMEDAVESEAARQVLHYWIEILGRKEKGLPRADRVAKMLEILAPIDPKNETVFQSFGEYLVGNVRQLSAVGKASLASAFPEGGGPDFPCKASLLATVEKSQRKRSASAKRPLRSDEKTRAEGERTILKSDRDRDSRRENPPFESRANGERRDRDRDRERGRDRFRGREDEGRDWDRHRDRGRDRDRDRARADEDEKKSGRTSDKRKRDVKSSRSVERKHKYPR